MLVVTADDYGKMEHATNSILQCFIANRITSASAMVFMEDSGRAASLALQTSLEIGLHLNCTMPFSADRISCKLRDHQNRVASYLNGSRMWQVIYNPSLAESFRYLFLSQQDEFVRLYGRPPEFYNGHHHMHLCSNMLLSGMIPKGGRVRRTFTFDRGERNPFNRLYRHVLDHIVCRNFISSDCFFSIVPIEEKRLRKIFSRAMVDIVEIEVHPENGEEKEFLLSPRYLRLMGVVQRGGFQELGRRRGLEMVSD